MSKYSNTLALVVKHWPIANTDDADPLVRSITEMATAASYDEEQIQKVCSQLSDFSDQAFDRGVNAHLL